MLLKKKDDSANQFTLFLEKFDFWRSAEVFSDE